ncbi:MAG: helix-turn-helix domain-containing protein [Clostridiales bacterium]|jgi:hypothetical protein|nr:helix-turn-helix domain-containing protein [Intestinimonas massiliensis (ex Afouda et al. 2020)]MDU1325207.1 helix-turn-helix domain-containing protein [Clostridiales bacterium]
MPKAFPQGGLIPPEEVKEKGPPQNAEHSVERHLPVTKSCLNHRLRKLMELARG